MPKHDLTFSEQKDIIAKIKTLSPDGQDDRGRNYMQTDSHRLTYWTPVGQKDCRLLEVYPDIIEAIEEGMDTYCATDEGITKSLLVWKLERLPLDDGPKPKREYSQVVEERMEEIKREAENKVTEAGDAFFISTQGLPAGRNPRPNFDAQSIIEVIEEMPKDEDFEDEEDNPLRKPIKVTKDGEIVQGYNRLATVMEKTKEAIEAGREFFFHDNEDEPAPEQPKELSYETRDHFFRLYDCAVEDYDGETIDLRSLNLSHQHKRLGVDLETQRFLQVQPDQLEREPIVVKEGEIWARVAFYIALLDLGYTNVPATWVEQWDGTYQKAGTMRLAELIEPDQAYPDSVNRAIEILKNNEATMEEKPIIVDENGCILVGIFRYWALRAMGYAEIPESWVRRVDFDSFQREYLGNFNRRYEVGDYNPILDR